MSAENLAKRYRKNRRIRKQSRGFAGIAQDNMKKNDYRYQIARSFTRKVNTGNYTSADFFASHTQEMPATTTEEEKKKISEGLFLSAKLEVEAAIIEFHKAEEKKKNIQSNTEFEFGLEKQAESDEDEAGSYEEKLKAANKGLGLK